jgi:hypothetical protein
MSAIDKTKLLERLNVPINSLTPQAGNPNRMSGRAFDLLVDNIQKTGLTDAILVRRTDNGYRIVGGHHRWEAAKYLGFEEVPVCVITDPDFDDEAETFQIVRMNVIRGKMDPASFFSMYEKMSAKYTQDILQDMFGFAESEEFRRLINQTAKALPPELQQKFKDAAKELKTIDGLAQLLNEMFTKFGSSLPFGFMVLDYGGKESVWIQISKKTKEALFALGVTCRENTRTMDDVLGGIVQLIAKGELDEALATVIENSPAVKLPEGFADMPTKELLAAQEM